MAVASTSGSTASAVAAASTVLPRGGARCTGLDLAEVPSSSSATAVLDRPAQTLTPEYKAFVRRLTEQYLAEHPEHADSPEIVSKQVLARTKGIPVSLEEAMRSQVRVAPVRILCARGAWAAALGAPQRAMHA